MQDDPRSGVVEELIDRFKDRCLMHDWTIEWKWMVSEEHYGHCLCIPGQYTATIEIEEGITSFDILRSTIAHEIGHLFLYNTVHSVDKLADDGLFTPREWRIFYSQFERSTELDVDHLEKVLCAMVHDDDLKSEWEETCADFTAKKARESVPVEPRKLDAGVARNGGRSGGRKPTSISG